MLQEFILEDVGNWNVLANINQLPKILETSANMLGKIVTGSANQNQEAKPASDLDGSTPSNQPPLVNILLLNQLIRPQSPIGPQNPHRAPVAKILMNESENKRH